MFLIRSRAEILALTGREIGYASRLLYDVTEWRDRSSSIVRTVTSQVAFIALLPVTLIESSIRAPLAFIATAFSSHYNQWHQGAALCILTAIYTAYAAMINLFVSAVCPYVVNLDMNLRMQEKDTLLFKACEEGRGDLAQQLLDRGANPHRIIQANATSALVPRMLGYLGLEHLFKHTPYEKELVTLRILSQWLGLSGTVDLNGEQVRLDTSPNQWMFDELSEALQRFRTDGDFEKLMLPYKAADDIQSALFNAYREKSPTVIAQRIREGKLTFIATGWQRHAICLAFHKGYVAISNRGEGSNLCGTLCVYKINPKQMTPQIINEIFMHQMLDKARGISYFYEKLPKTLNSSGKREMDTLCHQFKSIAPPPSEVGTCALDSKIGALRFAWALQLSTPPTADVFNRASLESDLFANWASVKCLDNERFDDLIPTAEPRTLLFAQAKQKWKDKCAIYRRIRRQLGLGLIWGYM